MPIEPLLPLTPIAAIQSIEEIAANDVAPLNPPDIEDKRLEVVIVAGIAYPDVKRTNITDDFSVLALRLTGVLYKKHGDIKVTFFNFFEGQKQELQVVKNKPQVAKRFAIGQKLKRENYWFRNVYADTLLRTRKSKNDDENPMYYPSITEITKSDSMDRLDYVNAFRAKKLTEKSISIGDVYNYILGLRDGSVLGLHVFSHSWEQGPVLVNTDDFNDLDPAKKPLETTKYLDKDLRSYDFDSSFGIIKDVNAFKKKFAEPAFSQIWGCNASSSPKRIVMKVLKSKNYEKSKLKPDEKLFEFSLKGDDFSEEDEGSFHELLLEPGATGDKSSTKSLNDIIKILQARLDSTSMKALATGTGKKVLGALPGTGSDFDHLKQFPLLMHINLGKDFDDFYTTGEDPNKVKVYYGYTSAMKFFKEHLGIKFKPEGEYHKEFGRGYAIYEP